MNETQCSLVPSEQQYVFEYRAESLGLGHDMPKLVPVTLRVQEAKAQQEITFLSDPEDVEALEAAGGPDCFLPAVLWQEKCATWAEQAVGTPAFKAWAEDLAVQCTPYLFRLYAELLTYYHLMYYEHLVNLRLQNHGLEVLEENLPHVVCSKDTNGTLIIGINPEDDVIIPLVDAMETRLKQVYSRHDLWERLGPWLWVSYAACWTIERMQDARDEKTLATLSEDEWRTTFATSAYDDEEFYHYIMLYLMQGYIHREVRDVMSLLLKERREQRGADSDLHAFWDLARDNDARLTVPYMTVPSSMVYHLTQEALYKKNFYQVDGHPWPTALLVHDKARGHAQLRPPVLDNQPLMPPEEIVDWTQLMWRQREELSDLDADALDGLSHLWLQHARSPQDDAVADIDDFLALRGLKPKRDGYGRRTGYEPEQRLAMLRALNHIQNLWLDVPNVEIIDVTRSGRRRRKKLEYLESCLCACHSRKWSTKFVEGLAKCS